nr:ribose-phosphate pyrophosphokinase-like domain-containing protein [Polycladomyces sp. WAk]
MYIVQVFSHPINDHLMELLIMADAAGRDCARSIHAVIPYFGYA